MSYFGSKSKPGATPKKKAVPPMKQKASTKGVAKTLGSQFMTQAGGAC